MKQTGLILGVAAGAGVLLLASGASARERGPMPYTRERFRLVLTGMGLDPAKLDESDWMTIDHAMAAGARISRLPPEEQGRALQNDPAFREYIRRMVARFGADFQARLDAA